MIVDDYIFKTSYTTVLYIYICKYFLSKAENTCEFSIHRMINPSTTIKIQYKNNKYYMISSICVI